MWPHSRQVRMESILHTPCQNPAQDKGSVKEGKKNISRSINSGHRHNDACSGQSREALKEGLGSQWSLMLPPPNAVFSRFFFFFFEAWCHAVFRGKAFDLKDILEENSLVHPLGQTQKGSEASPRTKESPQQSSMFTEIFPNQGQP